MSDDTHEQTIQRSEMEEQQSQQRRPPPASHNVSPFWAPLPPTELEYRDDLIFCPIKQQELFNRIEATMGQNARPILSVDWDMTIDDVGEIVWPRPLEQVSKARASRAVWTMEKLLESTKAPKETEFTSVFTTDIRNSMWQKPLSPNEALQALRREGADDISSFQDDLFWWQQAGARMGKLLLMREHRAFFGTETGLGKTKQVVAAWYGVAQKAQKDKTHLPTLLIAPSSHILSDWANTIKELPGTKILAVGERGQKSLRFPAVSKKIRDEIGKRDMLLEIIVVTIDTLKNPVQQWLREMKWRTIILDEITVTKKFDSKRAQSVLSIEAEYKIALIATPISTNVREDLRSILAFMKTDDIGRWEEERDDPYVEDYTGSMANRLSDLVLRDRLGDSALGVDKINVLNKIGEAATWMIRHTRSSINSDNHQGVGQGRFKLLTIESTYRNVEKQRYHAKFSGLLRKLKRDDGSYCMNILRSLRGTCFHEEYEKLAKILNQQVCAQVYTERWDLERLERYIDQKSAEEAPTRSGLERWMGPKQRSLLELLQSSGKKCMVIVADNVEQLLLVLLLRACGIVADSYHSGLSNEEQKQVASRFRNPEYPLRVLVISPLMGSVGINLQGAASIAYCMSITFSCAIMDQAFARIIRLGQQQLVHCVINVLESSFDTMLSQPQRRGKAAEGNIAGMVDIDIDDGAMGSVREEDGDKRYAQLESIFEKLSEHFW